MTYGTFAAATDGSLYPERDRLKRDFSAIHEAGFTVVRTYTEPPARVLEAAADWDLQLLVGLHFEDWRYQVGTSSRERYRMQRAARRQTAEAARRLVGCEQVLGICVANEVPADVIRWLGTRVVAGGLRDLVRAVHDADAAQLATYANYPTAEYMAVPEVDFVSFNVFLEDPAAFRRYLTRLQHLSGDVPLVLTEVGAPSDPSPAGRRRQAEMIDWQMATAIERGVAGTCLFSWTDDWSVAGESQEHWGFGLTTADRRPKPALAVASGWNARTVADLEREWPSLSIAVCAYNASATLDECLRHTCALEYPGLEILVVDDGSTDDTAAIARRHPRARLVQIEH
ncbi:MAG TPA: glycosyltransferase, partial [Acidimicrobiales bacterium]|nr:glycosyltransferase [Acidimicrobiales bacterium]